MQHIPQLNLQFDEDRPLAEPRRDSGHDAGDGP